MLTMNPQRRRNLKVVAPCLVIGIMIGVVVYSPTLYRLFCAATGFGGTTQRIEAGSATVSDRTITVRFDSNVAPDLQWRFEPAQREVRVHLGEQKLVFFTAENLSNKAIVGHATFNVTPETTGFYFNKIQCFCFNDERLDAHEKIDMPVVFFVDPALAANADTAGVQQITLSYTFFRSPDSDKVMDLSRFLATAAPDATRGQQLFAERCAACHAVDADKVGPMLSRVVGRKAGSAPGYKCSPALLSADLTWSPDALDKWLSDPAKFIAGATMPVRVLDASARRDIIAYLEMDSRNRSEHRSGAQNQSDQHHKE
jgi:cytochrome c oxidase assembly protein subunit 11